MGDKAKREVKKAPERVEESFSLINAFGVDPELVTDADLAHIRSLNRRHITKVEMRGYGNLIVTIVPTTDNPVAIAKLRARVRATVGVHLRAIINRSEASTRSEINKFQATHPAAIT
jgi:hypothetical protein